MSVFKFIFAEPEFVNSFCSGCHLKSSQVGCVCHDLPLERYLNTFKKPGQRITVPHHFLCLPGLKERADRFPALIDYAVFMNPNADPLGAVFNKRIQQEINRLSIRHFSSDLAQNFRFEEILNEWFCFVYGKNSKTGLPYWGMYRPGFGTLWLDFTQSFSIRQFYFAPTESQGFGALQERRKIYVP